MIDIGLALELLAAAVAERGELFVYPPVPHPYQTCLFRLHDAPLSLVGHALSLAHIPEEDLEPLRGHSVRHLYLQRRSPVRLSLGALVVLDTAQCSQDRGYPWGEALEHARKAAARYVALLPGRAFDAAAATTRPPAARRTRVRH